MDIDNIIIFAYLQKIEEERLNICISYISKDNTWECKIWDDLEKGSITVAWQTTMANAVKEAMLSWINIDKGANYASKKQ